MNWLGHAAELAVGALLLVSLASLAVGHFAARRHFAKRPPPALPVPFPEISILKPVEGAGAETYAVFASFCRLDYPGEMELLIGTIKHDDPVVAMAKKLQQEFPGRAIRLVFAEIKGTNRKTSIMEKLWREAAGEFLFFSDADVAAPADYLLQLVPLLAQPGVGCVTCLPRGTGAKTLGGKMVALHYGFNYVPQWMLAQQTTGIHWAIGHTMAVPRAVLERLGGFTKFLDHLADDYELGNRVSKLGLRVVVAPLLLDCTVPAESFGRAFSRLLRWKRTIRRSRGPQFAGVIITCPVFWALLLVLIHPMVAWVWGVLVFTLAIRWLLAAILQRRVKLPDWPRIWWLLPVVDAVEAATFLGAYLGNTVTWAGRRYRLLADGTLQPAAGAAAGEKAG